jgi:hypothetical protein
MQCVAVEYFNSNGKLALALGRRAGNPLRGIPSLSVKDRDIVTNVRTRAEKSLTGEVSLRRICRLALHIWSFFINLALPQQLYWFW